MIDPLIIPIAGIAMPLVLVPTILVMKFRHKRREWEHLERMRAMESPSPFARLARGGGPGGVAAIGAGVPIAAVLGAFLATVTWDPMTADDLPVPAIAWGCAVLIAAGGLFTAYVLAHLHARTQRQIESDIALQNAKPVFDPEAFDVVGSRG